MRCCTCARMPSCGVSKDNPVLPLCVTPSPQKLFCFKLTAEPVKVKFPVSRQDCAKAISPLTPSASPSERYSGIISRTDCGTEGFFFLRYAFICSAVATASPIMAVRQSAAEPPSIAALMSFRNCPIDNPNFDHKCSTSPWLLAMPCLHPSEWEITTPSAIGSKPNCWQRYANNSTAYL